MIVGELSEQKQESTPCTHFRIDSLRVNKEAQTILCEFSLGRMDKENVFHPAPNQSRISTQLNDENYAAAEGAQCSEETVTEVLKGYGIPNSFRQGHNLLKF